MVSQMKVESILFYASIVGIVANTVLKLVRPAGSVTEIEHYTSSSIDTILGSIILVVSAVSNAKLQVAGSEAYKFYLGMIVYFSTNIFSYFKIAEPFSKKVTEVIQLVGIMYATSGSTAQVFKAGLKM
jgi:hypothetical protein